MEFYDPSTQGDFADSRHYMFRELLTPQELRDRYGEGLLSPGEWKRVDQLAES